MKHITFHLDFVSPYAWLAFHALPQALEGVSHHVVYRPVLLGALLKARGNPGPMAAAPKADWIRRHAEWLGRTGGAGLELPAQHPFDPLPLLRLALQCSADGAVNRFVAGALFRHVWHGGQDALEPARVQRLRAQLAQQLRASPEQAKALLRANTDAAAARGVFGVPMFEAEGQLFWGLDSLPMLRACLTASVV